MSSRPVARSRSPIFYILLALPFIGLLCPAFYASAEPRLFGVPFFYWYQFLWVPLSVLCTVLAYWMDRGHGK
jgi:hypothetical protein